MLDSDTKRRIDSLRDILVGKIPNPQSQVEQITNALIYKFMDDMDQESIEMGGEGSFFVGDYEKYAWKNLLDPQLSGTDRVNLYSEGIERLFYNPTAPLLFRDIFKNAFLPFKDASTLNMFLKDIDEFFHYSDSEKLGDSFEYLLSFMGSQGDAGQFRTPRHIIDFIVEIIDPQKNETILDPACGTAGFLISSYKYILKTNTDKKLGDQLSAEDKKKVGENVTGYDISPEMIRLSLVNMYLHGFSTPKIDEYDTLSSEDKWNEYFDVILANPPFFSPKGGIQPHKRFGVKSKRAEVLFTSYILEHLKPNGRAGIIVPEGIIFKKDKAYKELRKQLVETALVGVISLPAGVFQPYSHVKTSILILDKKLSKESDSIFFADVKNDGFNLGAQRNPINENDLPEILETIKKNDYDKKVNFKEIKVSDIKEGNFREHLVTQIVSQNDFPFYPLKDVASVGAGNSAPQDQNLFEKGKHPFIRTSDVSNINFGEIDTSRDLLNEKGIEGLKLFPAGSILLPKSGASTLKNYRVMLLKDAYVVSHLSVIKADENKLLDRFLLYIFKNIDAIDYVTDPSYPSLNLETISSINIPLPPLKVQQEIVDELEGYQKIIDGCKQVVENYKPTIDIDPSWEMVELEEICEIKAGGTPKRSAKEYWGESINWYSSGELNDFYTKPSLEKISNLGLEKSNCKIFPAGSLLVGMYDTAAFKMSILKEDSAFNQAICGIKPNEEVNLHFLYIFFLTKKQEYLKNRVGVRQRNLSKGFIAQIQIPNIPLDTQNEIVQKIEEERKVIEGNKKLIEIYTKKIQDRINKVWGE